MNTDSIAEVAIDDDGRLLVSPSSHSYPMIYREAVEVHWDAVGRFLYSPKPREWSYLDWFKHIIDTAGDLVLSADTRWKNIPADLRIEAEAWIRQRK
jgi:DNA-binding transcriptional regulator/RsmH inhibitor MraZ